MRMFRFCAALGALFSVAGAPAQSTCQPDGVQASGSIYRICMPPPSEYNGQLVLWAHGFQDAGTPVQIPEDQLDFGNGITLPLIVNGLGYGFATNSYSKTGLAIREGQADLLDLVDIYAAEQGAPDKVLLTGASEGGIITALLIEKHPDVFDGGVAACGPVGDFPLQIDYFGDGRTVFEYFFPGLIPGDPFNPSQELALGWREFYDENVKPVILAPENRAKLDQLVKVADLPFDPQNYLETAELSVRDVLRYAVVNLNDARETLGGFPYDNSNRFFGGSDDDVSLNLGVIRTTSDVAAEKSMYKHYRTTGVVEKPLITIHTTLDQQVPFIHEFLYAQKTFYEGAFGETHLNFFYDRYGHCNFELAEVLGAFSLLLDQVGNPRPTGLDRFLDARALARYRAVLAMQNMAPDSDAVKRR